MVFDRIHHLTFVVHDLEESIRRYQVDLDVESLDREALPARGVRTARFCVGGVWIVLAQPTAEGAPMQHLREHGEGLLLVSYGVSNLDEALAMLDHKGITRAGPPRTGVSGWRVVDIATTATPGITTQLCQNGPMNLNV